MVVKRYLNSHSTSGIVKIADLISDGTNLVRLVETWFHPQGGGQKADQGTIGDARVLHVAHNGEEIDHYVDTLAGLVIGNQVPFTVDLESRILNMVYHTAGHLLACLMESLYPGLIAVAGHHWPGQARVEFTGNPGPDPVNLGLLNQMAAAMIAQDLRVDVTGDPFTSRTIRIGELKDLSCGGVHVESLGQIKEVRATGAKTRGDRLRISYQATPRASCCTAIQ